MLSSDKTVESVAQLIEVLKHYLGLQTEFVKLDVVDKVVRLLTAATLAILFFLLVIAVMMFLSFAVAYWLSRYIGLDPAFFVIAGAHLVLFLLFITFRHSWIERPLVRFLAGLLMSR